MTKKTVLIDLDGVLNTYCGNFEDDFVPDIKDGALEFLKILSKDYLIKLFTARNNELVKIWVKKNNLSDYISGITNIKEPAFLILDDRCIKFEGDYAKALDAIKDFKVWYK